MTKLEQILKEQGRTHDWLCRNLGMKRTTCHFFIKGKRPKKIDKYEQAAKLLGVKVGDVM